MVRRFRAVRLQDTKSNLFAWKVRRKARCLVLKKQRCSGHKAAYTTVAASPCAQYLSVRDSVGEWQYGQVIRLFCRFPCYLRLPPDHFSQKTTILCPYCHWPTESLGSST
jgi:hypothetical protein